MKTTDEEDATHYNALMVALSEHFKKAKLKNKMKLGEMIYLAVCIIWSLFLLIGFILERIK